MSNPQINELVDYIKKAKQAGQSDDQTRQILLKNGWSDAEVAEAFTAIIPVDKPQQQQPQAQPQVVSQPKPQSLAQPQAQSQPTQSRTFETRKSHSGMFFAVLIILAVLGTAEYFIVWQNDSIKNYLDKFLLPSTNLPAVENEVVNTPKTTQLNLATVKITAVLQDYDINKGVVSTLFSKAADKVAYCAPKKAGGKIDCFLNDEKLSNAYSYKPYWIGISPDGKRVVFLYLDSVKKQSFIFENGVEGTRYDGTITSPAFTDDSQSFFYTVMGKDNKSFIVFNGNVYAPHDKIYGTPQLSSDGRYLLYGVRDGQDIFWVADQIK